MKYVLKPFKIYKLHNPSNKTMLNFQDVLAEIPSQVVQYMQRNGIKPGIPDIDVATRHFQRFNFND